MMSQVLPPGSALRRSTRIQSLRSSIMIPPSTPLTRSRVAISQPNASYHAPPSASTSTTKKRQNLVPMPNWSHIPEDITDPVGKSCSLLIELFSWLQDTRQNITSQAVLTPIITNYIQKKKEERKWRRRLYLEHRAQQEEQEKKIAERKKRMEQRRMEVEQKKAEAQQELLRLAGQINEDDEGNFEATKEKAPKKAIEINRGEEPVNEGAMLYDETRPGTARVDLVKHLFEEEKLTKNQPINQTQLAHVSQSVSQESEQDKLVLLRAQHDEAKRKMLEEKQRAAELEKLLKQEERAKRVRERQLEKEKQLEKELLERIEKERQLEQERKEQQRLEKERLEKEAQLELERLEKELQERERLAQFERERLDQVKREKQIERERREQERQAKLEHKRQEKERRKREEQERLEHENQIKLEQERQLVEHERLEKERARQLAKEERQRKAQEKRQVEKEKKDRQAQARAQRVKEQNLEKSQEKLEQKEEAETQSEVKKHIPMNERLASTKMHQAVIKPIVAPDDHLPSNLINRRKSLRLADVKKAITANNRPHASIIAPVIVGRKAFLAEKSETIIHAEPVIAESVVHPEELARLSKLAEEAAEIERKKTEFEALRLRLEQEVKERAAEQKRKEQELAEKEAAIQKEKELVEQEKARFAKEKEAKERAEGEKLERERIAKELAEHEAKKRAEKEVQEHKIETAKLKAIVPTETMHQNVDDGPKKRRGRPLLKKPTKASTRRSFEHKAEKEIVTSKPRLPPRRTRTKLIPNLKQEDETVTEVEDEEERPKISNKKTRQLKRPRKSSIYVEPSAKKADSSTLEPKIVEMEPVRVPTVLIKETSTVLEPATIDSLKTVSWTTNLLQKPLSGSKTTSGQHKTQQTQTTVQEESPLSKAKRLAAASTFMFPEEPVFSKKIEIVAPPVRPLNQEAPLKKKLLDQYKNQASTTEKAIFENRADEFEISASIKDLSKLPPTTSKDLFSIDNELPPAKLLFAPDILNTPPKVGLVKDSLDKSLIKDDEDLLEEVYDASHVNNTMPTAASTAILIQQPHVNAQTASIIPPAANQISLATQSINNHAASTSSVALSSASSTTTQKRLQDRNAAMIEKKRKLIETKGSTATFAAQPSTTLAKKPAIAGTSNYTSKSTITNHISNPNSAITYPIPDKLNQILIPNQHQPVNQPTTIAVHQSNVQISATLNRNNSSQENKPSTPLHASTVVLPLKTPILPPIPSDPDDPSVQPYNRPEWAITPNLHGLIRRQEARGSDAYEKIFGPIRPLDLDDFPLKKK